VKLRDLPARECYRQDRDPFGAGNLAVGPVVCPVVYLQVRFPGIYWGSGPENGWFQSGGVIVSERCNMKKKYIVYLLGGALLGFCYPFLRAWLESDALSVVLAVLFVVVLRLVVLICFERKR
jgi:hypothetical protein